MRVLVAMLAVLAMVSVASADPWVWFEATNPGGSATSVITGGTVGTSTVLEQNPGTATWNIRVMVSATYQWSGLIGYDIFMKTTDNNVSGSAAVFTKPSGWTYPQPSAVGSGLNLAKTFAYTTGDGLADSTPAGFEVAHFTLTSLNNTGTGATQIFAGLNASMWSWYDSPDTMVNYGGNAGINGGVVPNWAPLPVITINQIPEPATLVLLGLGLVGLIRRR